MISRGGVRIARLVSAACALGALATAGCGDNGPRPVPGAVKDPFCSEDHWCWSNPTPIGVTFSGIWAADADDVWAVGERGTIMHWDGRSWSLVPSGTTSWLKAVWGLGPRYAWAVGADGALVAWNGETWTPFASPTPVQFNAVWGSSPDDVWAVGDQAIVVHWNGIRWIQLPQPIAGNALFGVWGSDSRDVWVAGEAGILHWTGGSWQQVEGVSSFYKDIWGSASNDVWAVGGVAVEHYDGLKWSSAPAPVLGSINTVAGSGAHDAWALGEGGERLHWNGTAWERNSQPTGFSRDDLLHVFVRAPNDVWAVGAAGLITHWDGTKWSDALGRATADNRTSALRAVAGSGPDDVWAVGDHGALRWNGSAWRAVEQSPLELWDVWVGGPNNVWVVGDGGATRWNGSSWESPSPGVSLPLRAVWGSGPSDVWAIGTDSVPMHWNGTEFLPAGDGHIFSQPSNAISGSGPDDVWIVGVGGMITHWDGHAWEDLFADQPALNGVWVPARNEAWIVADHAIIHAFIKADGSALTEARMDMFDTWMNVGGSSANDGWIVGSGGTLLQWIGEEWVPKKTGAGATLTDVWGSGRDTWIVGGGQTIMRRRW